MWAILFRPKLVNHKFGSEQLRLCDVLALVLKLIVTWWRHMAT